MSRYFKTLLIISLLLFIVIQFQRFLNLGVISLFLYIVEILLFILILVMIIVGIYKWMNNPIRSHIVALRISSIILGLIAYKPFGFINDNMIYGDDVLFVYKEGVASCSFSFSFKKNGIYIQESFCFGQRRKVGNYIVKNDTLYFDTLKINQYKFGVINRKDSVLGMYLTKPRTAKDFNHFKLDSAQLQKKINQSEIAYYKIYTIND